jgi:DeoR/GlpR family transcriptional regulator of sugar metabolism
MVTAADYAQQARVSVSTARRRLEQMVREGKASKEIGYAHHQPSNFRDVRTPPPARIAHYTIEEKQL